MQRGIVWVVDDDSSIRWVLERALAGAGLTCTTFENGNEVLAALASKNAGRLAVGYPNAGNGRAGAIKAD
ncbi:nitrogen regulation protein NR(I) [Salmonella enterica subsp. enterica serovar Thompson]|nr:nitrogen regulation protein NR(I) [Salmonella enterica subsp. enterica serovar Thompson]